MTSSDIILVIDPRVKNFDRNFYQELSLLGQRYQWDCLESPRSSTTRLQVVITVAFDGHFTKNTEENVIYIKIKEKNLSLFNQDNGSGHSFVISFASELEDLLPLINDINTNIKKICLNKFCALENKVLKSIITKKSIEADADLIQDLLSFHKDLFSKDVSDYFEISHIQACLRNSYKESVSLLPWYQVTELSFDHFLDFSDIGFFDYVLGWNSDINPIGLYMTLTELFKLKLNENREIGYFRVEQEVFSRMETPMILFGKSEEPILYNYAYTGLNIPFSDCRLLTDGKMISSHNSSYSTIVKKYAEQTAYIFIPIDESFESKDSSQDELGIISSSIAHELNNPLGGILAAIEVLSLDELNNEILDELTIMKQGVLRIRKLAQTFLGFSKNSDVHLSHNLNLKECLQQAIELTRFRLIESHLVLDVDIKEINKNSNIKNESFLTMLLYLVLGEVITQTERRGLVENKMAKKIELKIEIQKYEFSIACNYTEHIYTNCIESKLLNYLVTNLNLKFQLSESKISFINLN